MKLELHKSYRTRDGRKATITRIESSPYSIYTHLAFVEDCYISYTSKGEYVLGDTWPEDLVEEWDECEDDSEIKPVSNNVNHPSHYNESGIECIEAIRATLGSEFPAYCKGNVMKYMWRYTYKGKPVEDLKKAEWYLKKLIASVEESCYNSRLALSKESIEPHHFVDIMRGKKRK